MDVAALVVAGILILLVLLLAFIGLLYLTRGTPVSHLAAPGDADGPPAPDEPCFAETVELHTKTSLTDGHAVDVFTCGDELYPQLWEDLRRARHAVTLQLYYCKPGRMADEFADIVIDRAKAGVRVAFLRDAFGSGTLPKEYLERLERGGVRLATFRPTRAWELHKVQHRSHIRVVVVDGRVGYTGGFGLDDKWFGTGRRRGEWRDTTTRFTGKAVLQLQATFAAGWAEATGELITGDDLFPLDANGEPEPTRDDDRVKAGLLHASPTLGSTQAERFMALSIGCARRHLWISNSYFVPDDDFCGMLADAVKRGVDVRVLVPDEHGDVKATYWAGRARYERLLRAGVRIYEYQASMMHAKTLVADDAWCGIGTMNFDNRSLAFNDETMFMAHDRAVAARLRDVFVQDLQYAREVTLEAFLRRPWRERPLERGATLLSRWL